MPYAGSNIPFSSGSREGSVSRIVRFSAALGAPPSPAINPEERERQSDHGTASVEMDGPRAFSHLNDQESITDSIRVGGRPVYIQAADNLEATAKKQHERNEGSDSLKHQQSNQTLLLRHYASLLDSAKLPN